MIDFSAISGFDWDDGNARKNEKHNVSIAEAEQVFFNAPLLILADEKHSNQEARFRALARPTTGDFCISPSRCGKLIRESG
jgi:uncharacterized protein